MRLEVNPIINKISFRFRDRQGKFVSPKRRKNFAVEMIVNRKKAGVLEYEERTSPQAKELKEDLQRLTKRKALKAQEISAYAQHQGFVLTRKYKKRLPHERRPLRKEERVSLEKFTEEAEGEVFHGIIDQESEGRPLAILMSDGVENKDGKRVKVVDQIKKILKKYGPDNTVWLLKITQADGGEEEVNDGIPIAEQGNFSMNIKGETYVNTDRQIKQEDYINAIVKDMMISKGFRKSPDKFLSVKSMQKFLEFIPRFWLYIAWRRRFETERVSDIKPYDFQKRKRLKKAVKKELALIKAKQLYLAEQAEKKQRELKDKRYV